MALSARRYPTSDRATSRRGDIMRPRPVYQQQQIQPQPIPLGSAVTQSTLPQQQTGGAGTYDVNSDPAVAAANGLAQKIRTQAQASALAKEKQAAIEYGSAEGLQNTEGFKGPNGV